MHAQNSILDFHAFYTKPPNNLLIITSIDIKRFKQEFKMVVFLSFSLNLLMSMAPCTSDGERIASNNAWQPLDCLASPAPLKVWNHSPETSHLYSSTQFDNRSIGLSCVRRY